MTHIVFYEKPGCHGNARQRAALEAAGHTLEVRNLLAQGWTAERLLAFFAGLPVADWFNRAAPRVKSGAVAPDRLGSAEALALLQAEPLLIRRPLMQRTDTGARCVGFDMAVVDAWVGLSPSAPLRRSLEGCAAATPPGTPTCASPPRAGDGTPAHPAQPSAH